MSGKNTFGTDAAEKVGSHSCTLFRRFNPEAIEETFNGCVVLKKMIQRCPHAENK